MAQTSKMFAPPVWAASIGQALAAAAATERGLSSAEAAARLQALGPNELAPPRRFEAVRELLRYFANPLVLILLVASVRLGRVRPAGQLR